MLIVLLLSCCQNKQPVSEQNKSINIEKENDTNQTFMNRDKHFENFIFLNFWIGMNGKEYNIIKDSLVEAGVLNRKNDTTEFVINTQEETFDNSNEIRSKEESFIVCPIFNKEGLVEIHLKYEGIMPISKGLVDMYKTKYGSYKTEKLEKEYLKKFNFDKGGLAVEKAKGNEYIKYIWLHSKYQVTIAEWYSLTQSLDDISFYNIDSLTISYSDKDFLNTVSLEKDKKNQRQKDKIKKSLDLLW